MATKQRYILDDPYMEVGVAGSGSLIDISDFVNKSQITVTYVVAEGRHTFGGAGLVREISNKYSFDVMVNFETDSYGDGTINAIWGALMLPPFGAGTGKVDFSITPSSGDIEKDNPAFRGT